jgi:hypothetical protein
MFNGINGDVKLVHSSFVDSLLTIKGSVYAAQLCWTQIKAVVNAAVCYDCVWWVCAPKIPIDVDIGIGNKCAE